MLDPSKKNFLGNKGKVEYLLTLTLKVFPKVESRDVTGG
jgi:hypothetical protein